MAGVISTSEIYDALLSQKLSCGLIAADNEDFWRAWGQAYRNSYNPAPLPDELEVSSGSFEVDSSSYEAVLIGGIDHAARRMLMARAGSYSPRGANYPGLQVSSCALCGNLTQIVDAELGVADELNALWFDEKHAWLVNKFPYVRGDSLLLTRRHDDMELRHHVTRSIERGQGVRSIMRRPGATAGAKISADFLVKAFALADRYRQVAHRNHPLDGMSMPEHDHIKLIPESHPMWGLCLREAQQLSGGYCGELRNTPFSTLAMKDSPVALADKVSFICNRLEDLQVVFTFVYCGGAVFVTPRAGPRVDAADADVWIGNGVSGHIFEHPGSNPEHLRRALAYTARRGEFDWATVLDPKSGS